MLVLYLIHIYYAIKCLRRKNIDKVAFLRKNQHACKNYIVKELYAEKHQYLHFLILLKCLFILCWLLYKQT